MEPSAVGGEKSRRPPVNLIVSLIAR